MLGLIIEEAVALGATRDLLIATEACSPRIDPISLALVQRDSSSLGALALEHASERSKRWGVWALPVAPKDTAIRPVRWILARNPEYRDRIIRKGDLRVSILDTLRRDVPQGVAPSESALTRLSGATRTAVRKALQALELEGEVAVGLAPGNDRDHAVVWCGMSAMPAVVQACFCSTQACHGGRIVPEDLSFTMDQETGLSACSANARTHARAR